MITFEVKDMTCGLCVSKISKALKSVDDQVELTIDYAKQLIIIESTDIDSKLLQDAIVNAGFTPTHVEAAMSETSAQPKACCRHQH